MGDPLDDRASDLYWKGMLEGAEKRKQDAQSQDAKPDDQD